MTQLTNGYTITHINPKKSFRIHLLVFLLTVPIIWLVWYLNSSTYYRALWQTAAWATGIFFHYLGIYVFKKRKNR